MDILTFYIKEIHSERKINNRLVKVDLTYDFYGGPQRVTVGFFIDEWRAFRKQGSYPENRAMGLDTIEYFANLPDDKWYQLKYAAKLEDFSDEEIVEEFNKRLNDRLFHKISIEAKAIIK